MLIFVYGRVLTKVKHPETMLALVHLLTPRDIYLYVGQAS